MTSRTYPVSTEAESAILGAILLGAEQAIEICAARGLCAESFNVPANRVVYETVLNMHGAGKPIDAVTVAEELRRAGTCDLVGGFAALERLIESSPLLAHVDYHAGLLRDKLLLRRIIAACESTSAKCYAGDRATDMILAEAEQDILRIGECGARESVANWSGAIDAALSRIDTLLARRDGLDGLPTGFDGLDAVLCGLKNAEMIVLAARPSMGKTALGMNICEHLATHGVPVGIFSCEMSADALITRMLCSRAKVQMQAAMRGLISRSEARHKLAAAADRLRDAPLYIDDSSGLDVMDLRARARRMRKRHGIRFLLIDYLQLLDSRAYASQGRQLETSNVSANIKGLAKELNIPVMILSQLSRKPEDTQDGRPRISHLRDSGSIEQDADVVMLLWRPSYYQPAARQDNSAKLDIGKNRNGPIGEVSLLFDAASVRFSDATTTHATKESNDAD